MQNMIEGINAILSQSLALRPIKAVSEECLRVALELTESTFGFVAEREEDGTINTLAISQLGWQICQMDRDKAECSIVNMEPRGMFGEVINVKAPVVVNDVEVCGFSSGVPEGHPSITTFLGVPLMVGHVVFGEICVANKDDEYSGEDVDILVALSTSFCMALKYVRSVEAVVDKSNLLQAEEDAKEEMLNSLEHELRTPLGSIEIIANNVSEGVYDNDQQKMKDKAGRNVYKHVLQSRAILNQMLVVGKGLIGPLQEETQYVNLGEFLSELDEVPLVPNDLKSVVEFEVESSGLDDVWVNMSRHSLTSVFSNLLVNAAEAIVLFKRSGKVEVFVEDYNTEFVTVVVKDTGPGIQGEHREGLFFGSSTKQPKNGYVTRGQGLKIVKMLLERAGGEIDLADYEPGEGAVFKLKLKLIFQGGQEPIGVSHD